ncbi:MAG: hypothetical protein IKO74_11695 [Selenomonadaceae bacterium]|nr:hypothetical protein [Selenomonadaceae bacterium]
MFIEGRETIGDTLKSSSEFGIQAVIGEQAESDNRHEAEQERVFDKTLTFFRKESAN